MSYWISIRVSSDMNIKLEIQLFWNVSFITIIRDKPKMSISDKIDVNCKVQQDFTIYFIGSEGKTFNIFGYKDISFTKMIKFL